MKGDGYTGRSERTMNIDHVYVMYGTPHGILEALVAGTGTSTQKKLSHILETTFRSC